MARWRLIKCYLNQKKPKKKRKKIIQGNQQKYPKKKYRGLYRKISYPLSHAMLP